ncbi:MAG: IS66 family insertion sequence element accessory protein TnpA [Rectinemataceae bacterium]
MRRTQGEWVRIVARYQTSGLSVRRFSADEGVSEQSLRNWTRKLVGPRSIEAQKDTEFVEIVASPLSRSINGESVATAAGDGFVIRLESCVCIEVRPEVDRTLLEWLLTLLRQSS